MKKQPWLGRKKNGLTNSPLAVLIEKMHGVHVDYKVDVVTDGWRQARIHNRHEIVLAGIDE